MDESSKIADFQARIEGFELKEEIWSGADGCIFLAIQRSLDRPVALKILNSQNGRDQNQVKKRFLQEARNAGRLNHEHVIHIHDVVHDQGLVFFVMEYFPGQKLAPPINQGDFSTPIAWRNLAQALLSGLEHIHQNGMVHGFLSPATVLVGEDQGIKITDVGLSPRTDFNPDRDWCLPRRRLTDPTQHPTVADDLYAVGMILWLSIEKTLPFSEYGHDQLCEMLEKGRVQAKFEQSAFDQAHYDFLKRLLRWREPAFQSASEALQALPRPAKKNIQVKILWLALMALSVLFYLAIVPVIDTPRPPVIDAEDETTITINPQEQAQQQINQLLAERPTLLRHQVLQQKLQKHPFLNQDQALIEAIKIWQGKLKQQLQQDLKPRWVGLQSELSRLCAGHHYADARQKLKSFRETLAPLEQEALAADFSQEDNHLQSALDAYAAQIEGECFACLQKNQSHQIESKLKKLQKQLGESNQDYLTSIRQNIARKQKQVVQEYFEELNRFFNDRMAPALANSDLGSLKRDWQELLERWPGRESQKDLRSSLKELFADLEAVDKSFADFQKKHQVSAAALDLINGQKHRGRFQNKKETAELRLEDLPTQKLDVILGAPLLKQLDLSASPRAEALFIAWVLQRPAEAQAQIDDHSHPIDLFFKLSNSAPSLAEAIQEDFLNLKALRSEHLKPALEDFKQRWQDNPRFALFEEGLHQLSEQIYGLPEDFLAAKDHFDPQNHHIKIKYQMDSPLIYQDFAIPRKIWTIKNDGLQKNNQTKSFLTHRLPLQGPFSSLVTADISQDGQVLWGRGQELASFPVKAGANQSLHFSWEDGKLRCQTSGGRTVIRKKALPPPGAIGLGLSHGGTLKHCMITGQSDWQALPTLIEEQARIKDIKKWIKKQKLKKVHPEHPDRLQAWHVDGGISWAPQWKINRKTAVVKANGPALRPRQPFKDFRLEARVKSSARWTLSFGKHHLNLGPDGPSLDGQKAKIAPWYHNDFSVLNIFHEDGKLLVLLNGWVIFKNEEVADEGRIAFQPGNGSLTIDGLKIFERS